MKKLFSILMLMSAVLSVQAETSDISCSVIKDAYAAGLSAEEISNQFGVDEKVIHAVLSVNNFAHQTESTALAINKALEDSYNIVSRPVQNGIAYLMSNTPDSVKAYAQSAYNATSELGKTGLNYVQIGAEVARQQAQNGVAYVASKTPEAVTQHAQKLYSSAANIAQSGIDYVQAGTEVVSQKAAEYPQTTRLIGYVVLAGITAKVGYDLMFSKKSKKLVALS